MVRAGTDTGNETAWLFSSRTELQSAWAKPRSATHWKVRVVPEALAAVATSWSSGSKTDQPVTGYTDTSLKYCVV